jgi:phosphoadenosine phosphosulfate reductase
MNHYRELGFNIEEIRSGVVDKDKKVFDMGSDICCNINKVEPMRKLLSGKGGHLWITGLSRDQSETRSGVNYLESMDNDVYKLNPLIAWREADIWYYILENGVKYNDLYNKGYRSIGCKPCTTPVKNGEPSRAGRWRGADRLECGIHDKKI